MRHDMTSAAFAPLGGPAGEKNGGASRQRGAFSRKIGVLERDVADGRNIVYDAHRARIHAQRLAVAPVRADRVELMAKNIERQPLERLRVGPVDKRENLLVNGHRISRHGAWAG
jgi:hypothetical protein